MLSNTESETANKTQYIKGECYAMCPQIEIELREEKNLVHVLEVWGSERKLVKSYSRCAANSDKAIPKLLRPFHVLRDTVKYLLLEVAKRTDVSSLVVYEFVNDRLRSVRQDMIIQNLPPSECVRLLDPMIRFYVYYSYKLCNVPHDFYSPQLNKRHLQECLLLCLQNWVMLDKTQGVKIEDDLSESFDKLNVRDQNCYLPTDRILMEVLYILCNLNNTLPLTRYLNLSHAFKRNAKLNWAFKVGLAKCRQNYAQVFKALDRAPCPLSYCALYAYLPELQRLTLTIICHAYSLPSKGLIVPCDKLRDWLRLSSNEEVMEICEHYGTQCNKDGVRFIKQNFRSDEPLHRLEPRKLNEELDLSWENVLLYTTNDK